MELLNNIFVEAKYIRFLKWVLLISVFTVGFALALINGNIDDILAADNTGICICIFIVFCYCSVSCGKATLFAESNKLTPLECVHYHTDYNYWSSAFVKMGFIGTVIGFMALIAAMGAVDHSKPESIKAAQDGLVSGASVALYTTLVGLICSLALQQQTKNFGKAYNIVGEELSVGSDD